MSWRVALLLAGLSAATPCLAQEAATSGSEQLQLSAAELFAFADNARAAGDFETAEAAYRALANDPDPELRTEARFRLALMLADDLGRHREAATLLREILDVKPDAARVRIELARMQVAMGNTRAAERELRAAQASGLPAEVEQLVRFYANALNSRRPFGASVELAIAPDSNINRATSSDTLGTVIGDFDLSEDAQATSGIGLSAQSQLWARIPMSPVANNADLVLTASGSGDFYRKSRFDSYTFALGAGPQVRIGADRFSLSGILAWRWFGQDPYTTSYGANGLYEHPMGKRAQLRVDASAIHSDDKLNDLRDSDRYSLSVGVDRALSSRFGGGVRVRGEREVARDPAYSTASGGVSGYLFRELGQTTAVLDLGYSHLEADERIFLYPERRREDRFNAGLSGTFRGLRVGTFAPVARLRYERNISTVGIYDYDRIAAEFGITGAF